MENISCSKNYPMGSLIVPIVRKQDFCFPDGHSLNYRIIETYTNQFLNNQYKSINFNMINKHPFPIKNSQRNKLSKIIKPNFGETSVILKKKILKKVNLEFLASKKIVFQESNVRFIFEIAANLRT